MDSLLEVRQAWAATRLWQTEQSGERTTTLIPRADRDGTLAIIEERDFAILDREAEPLLTYRQTPLVPKSTTKSDRRRHTVIGITNSAEDEFAIRIGHRRVHWISIGVGHDISDASLSGSGSNLPMQVARRMNPKGDSEELLALKRAYNRGFIIVVDPDDVYTLGERAFAVLSYEGGDVVFSGFRQGFGECTANATTGLYRISMSTRAENGREASSHTPTIATFLMGSVDMVRLISSRKE